MPPLRSSSGQATVEFVALLPLLAVVALGLWQVAVAGHAMWSASAAARAASRAAAVSDERAALRAARKVAGAAARLRVGDDGGVRVTVPIESVLGAAPLTTVSSTARFEPQR